MIDLAILYSMLAGAAGAAIIPTFVAAVFAKPYSWLDRTCMWTAFIGAGGVLVLAAVFAVFQRVAITVGL